MQIFYIAPICPKCQIKETGKLSAGYKFNKTLAEGFASLPDAQVFAYIPYLMLKEANSRVAVENSVSYISVCGLRNNYWTYARRVVQDICKRARERDSVIVCDALSISGMLICFGARMRKRIKNIFLVTDFPQFVGSKKNKRDILKDGIQFSMMKRGDAYILLTKEMNDIINPSGNAACIMEGVCEESEAMLPPSMQEKSEKKVCLYAGSLHKEYGIDRLIDAFSLLDMDDCELHIYGAGNYEHEIERICKNQKNIIFGGSRPNEYILKEERKAMLLVNPRPNEGEYVKYSFPSKTLEYMASGTPVLMTKLTGLPKSYEEYIYLIEKETVEGYREALQRVLTLDRAELLKKGERAQQYVRENKTGKIQAERICRELLARG